MSFIPCYPSLFLFLFFFSVFWQCGWIRFILPVRLLNKQEMRSEVRWGDGKACLLARSSLASRPLASCQLRCPSPSLNPLRRTGCQCGEAANMPRRTNTPTANFLLSLYLSICRPSVFQVERTGKQMDWRTVARQTMLTDKLQTFGLEGPLHEGCFFYNLADWLTFFCYRKLDFKFSVLNL